MLYMLFDWNLLIDMFGSCLGVQRTFEYVVLSEGHEVTTYVSDEDGQRYYMDWDKSKVGCLSPPVHLDPNRWVLRNLRVAKGMLRV